MDFLIEILSQILHLFHNLPEHLQGWAAQYGVGLYIILGLIIFCETGLVVTPFLPGDSLLFATGALIAHEIPGIHLSTMAAVLAVAAILGDITNYSVGKFMAPRLFRNYQARWLNKSHLERTQEFFARHGGKTIVLARFMPIVRTYAPFVAGLSQMRYAKFFIYNVVGGLAWICSFLFLGYFFGNLPAIKANFQYVILAIIAVSLVPLALEAWRARRKAV